MKIISLWQPWASLLVTGQKKVETRSWPLRGSSPCVLAIHAAKKWNKQLEKLSQCEPFASCLSRAVAPLPLGCVVGIVAVKQCLPSSSFERNSVMSGFFHKLIPNTLPGLREVRYWLSDAENAFGDFSEGRWGWVCSDFYEFQEPIPLRGAQGIFHWKAPSWVYDLQIIANQSASPFQFPQQSDAGPQAKPGPSPDRASSPAADPD